MKEPVTSKHSCFRCAQVARATRGRGLPSLGLMARLGVPVGGPGEKAARSWDHPTQPLMRTMMVYTHVLNRVPAGVRSQLDGL